MIVNRIFNEICTGTVLGFPGEAIVQMLHIGVCKPHGFSLGVSIGYHDMTGGG